jgi:serine/threonine protein kinase
MARWRGAYAPWGLAAAAGCVLFEMLTFKRPFSSKSDYELMDKIVFRNPEVGRALPCPAFPLVRSSVTSQSPPACIVSARSLSAGSSLSLMSGVAVFHPGLFLQFFQTCSVDGQALDELRREARPRRLAAVTMWLLLKDPADRPSALEVVQHTHALGMRSALASAAKEGRARCVHAGTATCVVAKRARRL